MKQASKLTQINSPCQINYIRARETHSIARVPILNASIIWVRQGIKQLHWQDNHETVCSGAIILLPAHSEFYITNQASSQGYLAEVISFSSSLIDEFLANNANTVKIDKKLPLPQQKPHYGFTPNQFEQKALNDLITTINNHAPVSIIQSYAKVVLMTLTDNDHLALMINSYNHDAFLSEKVKQIVVNQPNLSWSVAELAEQFNMSTATFRRHLANEKQSFRKIVDDVRMGLALSEVQNNKLSIQEITHKVGYHCPSNFSAKFKKRYGMSPSDLRKVI